jgi:hypothetical protein
MPQEVKVGTILMKESAVMTHFFGLESEPYSGEWNLIKALDGFALNRKIHAAGWNFFFMATELRVVFLGALGTKRIQNALNRVLRKVKGQNFNCLEVTGIVAHRFLGVPYTSVSAHSRHIQQSCQLPSKDQSAQR